MRRPLRAVAALALTVILVAGCGGGGSAFPSPSSQEASPSAQPSTAWVGSFADLSFTFDLPEGWVFGSASDMASWWTSSRGSIPTTRRSQGGARAGSQANKRIRRLRRRQCRCPHPEHELYHARPRGHIDRGDPRSRQEAERRRHRGDAGPDRPADLGSDHPARRGDRPRALALDEPSGQGEGRRSATCSSAARRCTRRLSAGTATIAVYEPEWEAILRAFEAEPAWYVSATIPVGVKPFYIAAGSDAIWVANADDGTIDRIDPSTNAVVATITLLSKGKSGGSAGPWAIAAGDGTVWVTSLVFDADGTERPGWVDVLDARTNGVLSA